MASRFSSGFVLGACIGAGVTLSAGDRWQAMRPLVKATLRVAFRSFEAIRRAGLEAGEALEDLIAETRHELAAETPSAEAKNDG